ncbi:MAG: hypothetical protein EOP85_12180, partial [Verrucomicrobiaceae bacterium]
MKRLLSCCLVPLAVTTVFPLVCAHAQDAAAPAAEATAAQVSFADPKAAYRSYIEAVRAMDSAAALKCWVYEPEQEEAMKVVSGVWISHRRFEKAVDSVPAVAAEKKSLEGYVRPDVTDQALD